jgi:hypothetical protein
MIYDNCFFSRRFCAVLLASIPILGCGQFEQSVACANYLECLAEVSPALLGEAVQAYGPDGHCWLEDETVADLCYRACIVGLEQECEP